MFDRALIKGEAKRILSTDIGRFILIGILWYLVTLSFINLNASSDGVVTLKIFNIEFIQSTYKSGVVLQTGLISVIFTILVVYPFEYGFKNYYRKSYSHRESYEGLLDGFNEGYTRIISTLFFRDAIVVLNCILFVVPGIMKAYSYYFVPYLLQERPDLSTSEILGLSKEMTYGYRWSLFVYDLSFILWQVASSLTFHLVGLYLSPYKSLSDAGVYYEIKERFEMNEEGNY